MAKSGTVRAPFLRLAPHMLIQSLWLPLNATILRGSWLFVLLRLPLASLSLTDTHAHTHFMSPAKTARAGTPSCLIRYQQNCQLLSNCKNFISAVDDKAAGREPLDCSRSIAAFSRGDSSGKGKAKHVDVQFKLIGWGGRKRREKRGGNCWERKYRIPLGLSRHAQRQRLSNINHWCLTRVKN